MKTLPVLTFLVISVAVILTSRLPETLAEPASATVVKPHRMIDLLSEGDVLELQPHHELYTLVLFNEEKVEALRKAIDRQQENLTVARNQAVESDVRPNRRNVEVIESRWRNFNTPWRVLMVGDDYVRLEPVIQLPGREEVSWIALSESMIGMIKSKK